MDSDKPIVYLETSFISHLTARPNADPLYAAKQQSSVKWWDTYRDRFRLVVSPTVYEERLQGEPEMAQRRVMIAKNAFLLDRDPAILKVARTLIEPAGPLPRKAEADALHVASATVYGCHFLLTWNFKHIANALIKRRIERILEDSGYEPPTTCTPDELMGELA